MENKFSTTTTKSFLKSINSFYNSLNLLINIKNCCLFLKIKQKYCSVLPLNESLNHKTIFINKKKYSKLLIKKICSYKNQSNSSNFAGNIF